MSISRSLLTHSAGARVPAAFDWDAASGGGPAVGGDVGCVSSCVLDGTGPLSCRDEAPGVLGAGNGFAVFGLVGSRGPTDVVGAPAGPFGVVLLSSVAGSGDFGATAGFGSGRGRTVGGAALIAAFSALISGSSCGSAPNLAGAQHHSSSAQPSDRMDRRIRNHPFCLSIPKRGSRRQRYTTGGTAPLGRADVPLGGGAARRSRSFSFSWSSSCTPTRT